MREIFRKIKNSGHFFSEKLIFRRFFGNLKGVLKVKPANIKDRCTKKSISKSESVVRLYDAIQIAYVALLEENDEIKTINCNVPIEPVDGTEFTSDFVCVKNNGDVMVRECVYRSKLSLPRTAKLLDASRVYWNNRGVTDWGVVIESGCSDE